ncbi:thiolase family protein [Nocardia sp. 2]|uniref:Thiolase family protein n=1 Tax=Nocardia acididurans TaxID=2802282 RepID=A0ABS1M6R8_9NOCA|nr:thiolase family protein [Nocardia acididurans]MBL1076333.1 thiolase family protein [Nocardia acididurans]
MRDAVIVAAVRSPIGRGKPGGALDGVHPVDLMAHSLRAVVERTGIDPARVDEVIGGVVSQVGEQATNMTRRAALAAGLPESVAASTIDRQCSASQQALRFAAHAVIAGDCDVVIATGVESVSRIPMGTSLLDADNLVGSAFMQRYPHGVPWQGISAELITARWGLSRAQLDDYALESHGRAAAATRDGRFEAELTGPIHDLAVDEGIRYDSSARALNALPPSFHNEAIARRFPEINWHITAGNASQLGDGSAAVMVTTSAHARLLGLTPLARIRSHVAVGDDPFLMLTAVVPATERALKQTGLTLADMDLIEINEAYASVILAWARETGADLTRVNVHGGAISLGHPLGASGVRITATLVHALRARGGRYGLQTMCESGGQANAMIIEAL